MLAFKQDACDTGFKCRTIDLHPPSRCLCLRGQSTLGRQFVNGSRQDALQTGQQLIWRQPCLAGKLLYGVAAERVGKLARAELLVRTGSDPESATSPCPLAVMFSISSPNPPVVACPAVAPPNRPPSKPPSPPALGASGPNPVVASDEGSDCPWPVILPSISPRRSRFGTQPRRARPTTPSFEMMRPFDPPVP